MTPKKTQRHSRTVYSRGRVEHDYANTAYVDPLKAEFRYGWACGAVSGALVFGTILAVVEYATGGTTILQLLGLYSCAY